MDLFNTAKSIDLAQIIERFGGLKLSIHKPSGHSCPICGHNGCFSIFQNNKTNCYNYKCFSCGSTGDGIAFVKTIRNLAGQGDAAKEICSSFGLTYDEISTAPVSQEQLDYYAINEYACKYYHYFLLNHKDKPLEYFKSRGLSEKTIKAYRLGFMPSVDKLIRNDGTLGNFGLDILSNKFSKDTIIKSKIVTAHGDSVVAGRYIFPIFNAKGQPIAFAGRSLDPSAPKYLNTSETEYFKKAYTLYNYHVANKYSTVYVVEGYMDALSLVEAGVPNVVASMGTAFGDTHLSCLKGKEIILALDNDGPGLEHMYNIIMSHRDINFRVCKIKGFKDFNEALTNGADIVSMTKRTISGAEFVIKYFCHCFDLSILDNRNKLWLSLAKLIGSPKEDSYRDKYPLNTLYTPFDHDYYWTIANRIVKGKRLKKGGE